MVVVDSSVWVSFLRSGNEPQLVQLLGLLQVLMHEMVLGEVAIGGSMQIQSALELLPWLTMVQVPSHAEVMTLVDKHQLYGCGVGYVDVHLLTAAVLQPGVQLWSHDKPLRAAAKRLGLAFKSPVH